MNPAHLSPQFGRRSFFALASGLLVPWQPERVYSFLPAWRLVPRQMFGHILTRRIVVNEHQTPNRLFIGSPLEPHYWQPPPGLPSSVYVHENNIGIIHPDNLLDVLKSADAYGYPRPVIT